MLASRKSRSKVIRSLTFASDSDIERKKDSRESDVVFEKKRKLMEIYDEFDRSLVRKPKSALYAEKFANALCLEIKSVCNEKQGYVEQYISGAKEACEAALKNIHISSSEYLKQLHRVRNKIRHLSTQCVTDIENHKGKGHEVLNAIGILLESNKTKQSTLRENLNLLLSFHNNFIKEQHMRDQEHTESMISAERDLTTDLSNIRRNLILQVRKKAMADMKENLKEMYLTYLQQANDNNNKAVQKY